MSPTNVEICFKCGRLLLSSEQAYVVGGKIVCAECDKLLRNEQVPQPASLPGTFPKTGKSIMKSDFIKKVAFIIIAIVVLILSASYSNIINIFGSKYEVNTILYNSRLPCLDVTVTGPATKDLVVVLIGPDKRSKTEDIEKADMLAGSKSVSLCFTDVGITDGVYTLVVANKANAKTIFTNKLDVVFKDGYVFEKGKVNGGLQQIQ